MANSLVTSSQVAPNGNWGNPIVLDVDGGTQIASAVNNFGSLDVFCIGNGNQVFHNLQSKADGSFLPQTTLPITAQEIVLVRNDAGTLELFYVGMDNNIYHNWASFGGWPGEAFGGQAKHLAVARNADGRLELFYVGMDNNIYHNWQSAPSNGNPGAVKWEFGAFRGQAKQLALGTNADGHLELLYIGMDDGLYHNWQTSPNSADWGGGGSGAQATGLGGFAKSMAVAKNQDGRLEIFYVGTDDAIYHNWQNEPNGDWHGQAPFGGSARQLSVSNNADGRLELFYIGMDGFTYHLGQSSLNGPWQFQPRLEPAHFLSTVLDSMGRISLFYTQANSALTGVPAEMMEFYRKTGGKFGKLGSITQPAHLGSDGRWTQTHQLGSLVKNGITAPIQATADYLPSIDIAVVKCFGTYSSLPSAIDSTYAVISAVSVDPEKGGSQTVSSMRTFIQDNVTAGSQIFKTVPLGQFPVTGAGLLIHTALWRHRSGDADTIRDKIHDGLNAAVNEAAAAIAGDPSITAGSVGSVTDWNVGGIKPIDWLTFGFADLIAKFWADDLIDEHSYWIPPANLAALADQATFTNSIRNAASMGLDFDVQANWPPTTGDEYLFSGGGGSYKIWFLVRTAAVSFPVLPTLP